MIWESSYWKEPLTEAASVVKRVAKSIELTDDQLGMVEYKVLTGFFSIRKLLEAGTKLSPENHKYRVSLRRAPILGGADNPERLPDKLNRHRIDEFYDFSRTHEVNTALGYLANQFVHSYVLGFWSEGQAGWSFLVASDKDKSKFCNIVRFSDIAHVFEVIGTDYPEEMVLVRDHNGDWIQPSLDG